jgi:phosphate transport system permease protein
MTTSLAAGAPVRNAGDAAAASEASRRRRRATNRLWWWGCGAALALVVAPVVSLIAGVVGRAAAHWHWSVLTTYTQGLGGGLLNDIEGTGVIVFGVLVFGGIIGVAGGVYLAEFCPTGKGTILRGASEVLAGVPSIILGYVGYLILVVQFHWHFSLLAALIVLTVLVLPYVTKTTEVAIRNVPTAYREGAEALGMTSGYTLRKLVIKPALPGIATGLIVAAAISVGETAPLLYTAGHSNYAPTAHLTHAPIGYLTYGVWTYWNQPQASAHQLAYSAALLLLVLVLALIVIARVLVSMTQRFSPDRPQRSERAGRTRRRSAQAGNRAGNGG